MDVVKFITQWQLFDNEVEMNVIRYDGTIISIDYKTNCIKLVIKRLAIFS